MTPQCAGFWSAVAGKSALSNPHRRGSKSWRLWLYGHFAALVALGDIDTNPVRL